MDRSGVWQVSECSGEEKEMEKSDCKDICCTPTTLVVKVLMMMMMMMVVVMVGRVAPSLHHNHNDINITLPLTQPELTPQPPPNTAVTPSYLVPTNTPH